MKVLIAHNAYRSHLIGGEDNVVRTEIAALKENLGSENVFEYIVSNDNLQFSKLAFTLWGDRTHSQKIKELIQNQKIDIVHVHNFFPLLTPSVFAAAKKAGAKVVHTLHNFRWWCLSGILYRPQKGICEKCVKKPLAWPAVLYRCYGNSFWFSLVGTFAFAWYRLKRYEKYIDAYFVLSHFQLAKLKTWLPAKKLHLKPNAVNITLIPTASKARAGYLFVGRLEDAKGIELLLSVWRELPSSFHLSIIGTGKEASLLEQRYAQSNIHFLGQLPTHEVLKKMRQVKYFLHTSLAFETFGLTLVEAFSQGTPVIGLARGTRLELIEHKKNGFICEPDNLKETILMSYDYPEFEALSLNAAKKAREFALPRVMNKQIALYKELL